MLKKIMKIKGADREVFLNLSSVYNRARSDVVAQLSCEGFSMSFKIANGEDKQDAIKTFRDMFAEHLDNLEKTKNKFIAAGFSEVLDNGG